MEKGKKEILSGEEQNKLVWLSDLFHRFFKGEATEGDLTVLENWQPENTPAAYSASTDEIEEGCSRVKKHLFAALDIQSGNQTPSFEKKKRLNLNIMRRYAAVAVLFVMLLSTGWYLFGGKVDKEMISKSEQSAYRTSCQTDDSEIKKIKLSDGSVLCLNGGSKISWITNEFNKEKRELWLDEGEVFFSVSKNPHKPFIIHSGNLETIVRGTSFNIKSYKELDESVVSVRSGKVEIRKGGHVLGMFVKNTHLIYNKERDHYSTGNEAWEDAVAWMSGDVVFHNADRDEFSMRLRQKFGVITRYKGDILANSRLNARFDKHTALHDLLNNVCTLYGLKYRIEDKSIEIYK